MKILMFGRGTISVIYGWALEKAGNTVEFYVRPGSAANYSATLNLNINDDRKNTASVFSNLWRIQLREDLPADHDYDLVIVSVQHYKFKEAAAFLSDRASKATILIFNNFWVDPLQQTSGLPMEQLAWGFPQAGGAFTGNTLNGALFTKVHFGTFGAEATSRELEVRSLFKKCGFKIQEHDDFKGWLWIHFAVVTGFFAEALPATTIGQVMRSTSRGPKAILQIRELLKVVKARGVDMSNNKEEFSLYNMPVWLAAFILRMLMRFNMSFKSAFSHNINFEEAQRSCLDLLNSAQQLSVNVPDLEAKREKFFQNEHDFDSE